MDLAGAINGALANNSKDIDGDGDVDEDAEPEREDVRAPSAVSVSPTTYGSRNLSRKTLNKIRERRSYYYKRSYSNCHA